MLTGSPAAPRGAHHLLRKWLCTAGDPGEVSAQGPKCSLWYFCHLVSHSDHSAGGCVFMSYGCSVRVSMRLLPTHFWVVFMIHRNIFSTERFGHTRQGPSPDAPASPASPMVAVVPATRGGCGPATGAGHRGSLEREAAVERGITSLDGKSHVSPKDPLRLKLSVFL